MTPLFCVHLQHVPAISLEHLWKYTLARGLAPINDVGYAVASCPEGTTVLSGGYHLGFIDQINVYNSTKKDNGWQIFAHNSSEYEQTFWVYATCLRSDVTASSHAVSERMTFDRFHLDGPAPSCDSGLGVSGGFVLEAGMDIFRSLPYDDQATTWQGKA